MPMSIHKSVLAGFVSLCVLASVLLLMSAPALASTPEKPELLIFEVTASAVVVSAVLNPNAPEPREPGSYQYVYRPSSKNECEGPGEVRFPEPPNPSQGIPFEQYFERISGLEPGTEYAMCVVATEPGKTEPAISNPMSFTTLFPPEQPTTLPASQVSGASVTLNGILNPNQEGHAGETYGFFYRQGATSCEGSESHRAPVEPQPANGKQAEHVSTEITGLLPKTRYVDCLHVQNVAGEFAVGGEQVFETPAAAPSVADVTAVHVEASQATLTAQLSPGGALTSYQIEYGPGKLTPEQIVPASSVSVGVSDTLTGLSPSTQYHIRYILKNEVGTGEASSLFTTIAGGQVGAASTGCPNATLAGFDPALPDCRAYELVSSAHEVGDVYVPGGIIGGEQYIDSVRPFRSASDGNAFAYIADPGPVGGDGESAKGFGNEYLARRGPAAGIDGWETANITPPPDGSAFREYEAFSPDLSVGILASESQLVAARPVQQSPAGCAALYSVLNTPTESTYQALFSETLSPGFCGNATSHGFALEGREGLDHALTFSGESRDHAVKFFQTPAALAAPAIDTGGLGSNLYESVGGSVKVVSVLPDGEVARHSTYGGPSELPDNAPDLSATITSDGSRAFWSTVEEIQSFGSGKATAPVALYAREDPASGSAKTIQLDAAQQGVGGAGGKGEFWAASGDGSRVFFTDCNRLTADSTADAGEGCQHLGGKNGSELLRDGNDLYEYDFAKPVGQRLIDLTVDHNAGDPLGANVQGVIGVSDDGAYVYFVAGGALEAEPNGRGELPSPRKCEVPGLGSAEASMESMGHLAPGFGCNLFEMHNDGEGWGKPRFIASLAALDDSADGTLNDPGGDSGEVSGDWMPNLGSRTAEVSADGKHVVFESSQELTGYDSSDLVGVGGRIKGGDEVFVYDANASSLSCVSCDPRGAQPLASILTASAGGELTYLPASFSQTFMHNWINADGSKVFFDSSQALVSGDSNGAQDVYEWEAEGAASCPKSTSIYGGCIFLLSGGESPGRSFLADVDGSGENVFIVHRGPLGGAGPRDDKYHLYDARVGGGFATSSLGCTGTGCQGVPPAAPLFATPASVTFNGVGNFPLPAKPVPKRKAKPLTRAQKLAKALRTCRKKSKKAGASCERQARQKYGTAKAKSNRRAK
jgi:hypothetical protein